MKNGATKAKPVSAVFSDLLDLLRKLQKANIAVELRESRDDAVMVRVNVPGERWEIEFLEEGDVDVEVFRSDGPIDGREKLTDLFARHSG